MALKSLYFAVKERNFIVAITIKLSPNEISLTLADGKGKRLTKNSRQTNVLGFKLKTSGRRLVLQLRFKT